MKCAGARAPTKQSPYGVFQPFVPQGDDLTSDDADFAFLVIARLKQGVAVGQASTELACHAERLLQPPIICPFTSAPSSSRFRRR